MSFSVADVNHRLSAGTVSAGFEALRNQFDAYLLADPARSAQLSEYWDGELVVDPTGGLAFEELRDSSRPFVHPAAKLTGLPGCRVEDGNIDDAAR